MISMSTISPIVIFVCRCIPHDSADRARREALKKASADSEMEIGPTIKIADTEPRELQKSGKSQRRSEFLCSLHLWSSWKPTLPAAHPTSLAPVESMVERGFKWSV
jgi:hypothetical protein